MCHSYWLVARTEIDSYTVCTSRLVSLGHGTVALFFFFLLLSLSSPVSSRRSKGKPGKGGGEVVRLGDYGQVVIRCPPWGTN